MFKLRYLLVVIVLFVSSCATNKVALREGVNLSAISIEENISIPSEIYYVGPGFGVGMLFGAIGGAIAGANSASKSEVIKKFAKEHEIEIEQIVRRAFESEINKNNNLEINNNSENKLSIIVKQYGLSIPNGFSRKLVPVLLVEAEIKDGENAVIWRDRDHVLPLSKTVKPFKLNQLKANPKLLENAWKAAAERAAKEIIGNM